VSRLQTSVCAVFFSLLNSTFCPDFDILKSIYVFRGSSSEGLSLVFSILELGSEELGSSVLILANFGSNSRMSGLS
jgi:hypothetical protein